MESSNLTKYMILPALFLLLGWGALFSQLGKDHTAIGFHPGLAQFKGPIGTDNFLDADWNLSVGFGHRLGSSFNAELLGSFAQLNYQPENDSTRDFQSLLYDAKLLLHYKFANGYMIKNEDARVQPFLFTGIGLASAPNNSKRVRPVFPIGFGFGLKVNEFVGLQLRSSYNYVIKENDYNYFQHTVGVVFGIAGNKEGKKSCKWTCCKKKEGSGAEGKTANATPKTPVAKKPKQPGTKTAPEKGGVKVKTDLKRTELAGVKAVTEAKITEVRADADNDGVLDHLDGCPKLAGPLALGGCPDSDGDGVRDLDDKCPNVKGLFANKGCPTTKSSPVASTPAAKSPGKNDGDGDGVLDGTDKCPWIRGVPALFGCPDADKDGVADDDDKCPDMAGTAANNGCPEWDLETASALNLAIEGIKFETGSNVIRTGSYSVLDNVVKVLKDHPKYNVEIAGYTDSAGDYMKNLTLSENRSKAVKDYLVRKGIAADRLTASGYGEANPITENFTAEGRAKNRRVELKIFY